MPHILADPWTQVKASLGYIFGSQRGRDPNSHKGSRPISSDTGLSEMRALIASGSLPPPAAQAGSATTLDTAKRYLEHLLSYVDRTRLRKLKVVVNAGNGGAGLIVGVSCGSRSG